MRIAFIYLPHRIQRLPQVSIGEGPSDFFYGAVELANKGYTVGVFEAVEKPRRSVPKWIAEKCIRMRYLPPKVHIGILDAVGLLLKRLQGYDVLVATTSDISLSLGIWRCLGVLRRPILGIQCGLLNYQQNPLRDRLTGIVLRQMHSQLFGYGELQGIHKMYRIEKRQVDVNLFGVDTQFWSPSEAPETGSDYVLSLGSDARRDYDTLVRAARLHEKTRFKIITKRALSERPPNNVELLQSSWGTCEVNDLELRRLYRHAACIVVPLKQTIQPSGQSVTLQAMSCEKPVILTRTQGLWESQNLKDGENIRFVPPGDHRRLSEAISKVLESHDTRRRLGKQGRRYVLDHARIEYFAQRIENRCRLLLEGENRQ